VALIRADVVFWHQRRVLLQYNELVKLARFCADQARTSTEKDVASRAWRLAVQYREDAARLGEPPDIGVKPPHLEEM